MPGIAALLSRDVVVFCLNPDEIMLQNTLGRISEGGFSTVYVNWKFTDLARIVMTPEQMAEHE